MMVYRYSVEAAKKKKKSDDMIVCGRRRRQHAWVRPSSDSYGRRGHHVDVGERACKTKIPPYPNHPRCIYRDAIKDIGSRSNLTESLWKSLIKILNVVIPTSRRILLICVNLSPAR
jgi:hypothetical protein